jgi:hypothetical protein
VPKDGELELLELGPGLETELLVELLTCGAEGFQRLCLSARAVEGDDQQPAKVLS